jgi:hypothetical protein
VPNGGPLRVAPIPQDRNVRPKTEFPWENSFRRPPAISQQGTALKKPTAAASYLRKRLGDNGLIVMEEAASERPQNPDR